MSILVDDSNKTACRAAEAGLQQKNCAALVRPAGTGKGCIVWELLDAHPEMRVLWVVSCAARLELRRALTKRLGRTLGGRVRLMSCEQLSVQNALGWVALAHLGDALQALVAFVLRCYRITLAPLVVYCALLWGAGLGGGYWLAYGGGGPWSDVASPTPFWAASAAALAVTALLFVAMLWRAISPAGQNPASGWPGR